jgi:hypothetical protein
MSGFSTEIDISSNILREWVHVRNNLRTNSGKIQPTRGMEPEITGTNRL